MLTGPCEHGYLPSACPHCPKLASLRATVAALTAERDEAVKNLDWWKGHTEQLENNWESLVEITRKERDALTAENAALRVERDDAVRHLQKCLDWVDGDISESNQRCFSDAAAWLASHRSGGAVQGEWAKR